MAAPSPVGSAQTVKSSTNNISSLSGSVTVPSGQPNIALVVHLASSRTTTGSGAPAAHSSLTYNGVAMTKVSELVQNSINRISQWVLANPTTGSNTLLATFASGNCTSVAMMAQTYKDVHQSSPAGNYEDGNYVESSVGTPNAAVTTANAASTIVGCHVASFGPWYGPWTPGTGVTETHDGVTDDFDNGEMTYFAGYRTCTTAAAYDFQATPAGSIGVYSAAFELKTASGAAASVEAAALALGGYAPTVSAGAAATVALAPVALAAYAPAVTTAAQAFPDAASISLAAYAPAVAVEIVHRAKRDDRPAWQKIRRQVARMPRRGARARVKH